jgi:ATPase subunit of ABC transporter with duplicated ATPase domains
MLAKMMLNNANALIFDEPTNHLDLESITALNNSLIEFSEVILFTSHDHKFVATLANRIVELTPGGVIDQVMGFDEYLASAEIDDLREQLCSGVNDKAA